MFKYVRLIRSIVNMFFVLLFELFRNRVAFILSIAPSGYQKTRKHNTISYSDVLISTDIVTRQRSIKYWYNVPRCSTTRHPVHPTGGISKTACIHIFLHSTRTPRFDYSFVRFCAVSLHPISHSVWLVNDDPDQSGVTCVNPSIKYRSRKN